jgi:hypothetical protein
MPEQQQQDPISALLSEFGTRLNEIEEKQRLIKDRILLVGENLISTKEEYDKEISSFKKQITEINSEIKTISQTNKRVIEELENFARRTELEIVERQLKMFQPLKFTTSRDVEKIINEKIKNIK